MAASSQAAIRRRLHVLITRAVAVLLLDDIIK